MHYLAQMVMFNNLSTMNKLLNVLQLISYPTLSLTSPVPSLPVMESAVVCRRPYNQYPPSSTLRA